MRVCTWLVVLLGLCGSLLAAGAEDADAKLRAEYAKFQAKWALGNYKECASMFAPEAALTISLKDAVARRGVPEGTVAHNSSGIGLKTEAGRLTAKVRSFVLLPAKPEGKEKTLLVIDETFVIASKDGGGWQVAEYQRADVTAEVTKTLNGFIEEELKQLRDKDKPVPGRQFAGGVACENLRALGEVRRAWPIVQEMFALGTGEVLDANLMMMQNVLKSLMKLEPPPEEYRELVEKILAMKVKGKT